MYYQHLKTKAEDFEFYAICHGATPSKHQSEPMPEKSDLLFGDPTAYDKLDADQKENYTNQMKNKFKQLFDQTHLTPAGGVGKVQKW